MGPLLHYAAAGTTRPACGATTGQTTATIADVTCGACRQTMATVNFPTPHGRMNS